MKDSNEVTSVCINPHIVGWYLINELKQLKKLKRCEEERLSQTNHPIDAKTMNDIYVFSGIKKQIEWPIKCKLQGYKKSFDADELLTFEEIVEYFEEQLTALNAKKTIEKIVVDVAYAAHEHAEKNHLIDAAKMGKRLFKTVIADTPVKEHPHVSDAIIKEKPAVTSSNNSTVTSALSVAAATFIPLSQKKAMADSIDEVDPKIVRPKVVRFSLHQNLIHSPSIPGKPHKNITSPETQRCASDSIQNSRLYRFWLRTDVQAQVPQSTNTTSREIDLGQGLV